MSFLNNLTVTVIALSYYEALFVSEIRMVFKQPIRQMFTYIY